jgi:von Willebrand factor A domain-containing protein 5
LTEANPVRFPRMLRIKVDSNLCRVPPAQPVYIPLKRVHIEATIRSFAANVTIKQLFRNEEATPVEAVYCFPIEEQAAIYSFAARIDDREIVAELKEQKEAQKEYTDALRQGDGAYLLEQDEKSQDNFIISVGALPPGKECHISISYVTELQLVHNASKIRFVIPTTIAPRYNPDKNSFGTLASTTSNYVQTTPYTIELQCRVDRVGIKSVSSMSHPIRIDLAQQEAYAITLAQENTHLDRDILIDIDLLENRSNTIVALEPGAVMAALTPNEEDCQQAMNTLETTNEFIFVIDCSGSMSDENKIGLARQAMLLFLKSLPVGSHFNIVQFGSTHKALFPSVTAVYNEENAQKAELLTNRMQANFGGTELVI